ncbi:hypothetical protein ACF3OF_02565 [Sneathia vaginalis]
MCKALDCTLNDILKKNLECSLCSFGTYSCY